eukprot:TRINITY_DN904_c0_g1_i2.p3 TRINITY_DN904_c0_g1~~TRINITY_DN904_c0_g1_i2.p3  ORF type:complete len:105 (+),score=11.55 TRINITY_DN904_c0_g1_i2:48-317(+)
MNDLLLREFFDNIHVGEDEGIRRFIIVDNTLYLVTLGTYRKFNTDYGSKCTFASLIDDFEYVKRKDYYKDEEAYSNYLIDTFEGIVLSD